MNPWFKKALSLAKSRRGFCAPNPSVGCVVVKNEKMLSEGVHIACGKPHAEVDALTKIGEQAKGADLYVTLEPCCHWGKTPPCTQAIINAGIKRVYYAFSDPNPKVAGQGEATLKAAGIVCEKIPCSQIYDFYQSYAYWTKHKKPFVTVKLAVSLDGFIAGPEGEPVEITAESAKQFTFENRLHSDAILTTINTVQNDNPMLNVRLGNTVFRKPVYILDSHLQFRLTSQLMKTAEHLALFHQKRVAKGKVDLLQKNDIDAFAVRRNTFGLNLEDVLKHMGKAGIHDVWVEAGSQCFEAFWKQGLANRIYLYYSPKKLGEGLPAFKKPLDLSAFQLKVSALGSDTLVQVDLV